VILDLQFTISLVKRSPGQEIDISYRFVFISEATVMNLFGDLSIPDLHPICITNQPFVH
jgi:hypothetical protein